MGVPKFFRYISERYPCLSELARENCIPDFDNLYLDMNGIIHNCSHPDDGNVHFNISEEDMFKDICNYIDKLFFLIKPQRLFFMAVDGVAPRAKMNQQRGRRFRSAKEAETLSLQAKNRGEVIENDPFDSNCITPGTEFMQRLHNALRFFVKNKISTDPLWQKCRVILSGHDSPGEGEHKIMDYIRYLKSQKDFDPHTRHCLYGLDADLIFLGLCTHELHFVVLREEVKFGRKTKRASVEETRFFLLHLGLFKEYLELEFATLKHYESFNMSKLVDDWVLMGFLVGNDFIPHLPCLHISSNALPLVYQTYIKIFPKLDGNINENGVLNLKRLEIFFEALADVEFQMFEENHADLKYFEGKQTKNGVDEAFDFDVSEILENKDDDLAQLIESSRQLFEGDEMNEITSDDEEQHIFDEFRTYKRNYYIKKLHYEEMTPEVLAEQTETYVTALQWVLDYYYKGVQSWSWYYPHHYAPFISDLKNFKDLTIKYEMSQPFLPFEQLLAVLPAASRTLLPEAYQHLFISPDSEIIEFYPTDFETDLNGKKNEWESIILIPFIDEKLLLRAMKKCEGNLKPSEVKRNTHGPMLQYDYTSQSQGECQSSYSVKAIYHVFCTEKSVWRDEIFVSNDVSPLIEMENAKRDVFYPGFPSMKHLKFKFSVKYARVKVFDFPTRNESMVLLPEKDDAFDDIEMVAKKCIDQIVYVGWPHLIKAKVMSVSNTKICITSTGTIENNTRMFEMQCRSVREHLSSRMGIEVPDFKVLVHVRTLVGTTLSCGSQGRVTNNDVWSSSDISYPPSVIVFDLKVHSVLSLLPKKVENIFPVDSQIFFVGNPYFGSEGTVLDPLLVYEVGRLKVSMTVLPEPNLSEARAVQNYLESLYCNAYDVQAILGLSTRCLSKLTAQLWLFPGNKRQNLSDNNAKKTNIGLLIKFPKQNEELSGYTHRKDNSWFFSPKAVALVKAYIEKFPLVTQFLQQICSSSSNEFHYADIFPNVEVAEKYVENIVKWLGEQEFTKADRVPFGTKCVEKGAVEKVIESIEKLKTLPVKTVKLQVKPHLLMKPDVNMPEQYKPKGKIRLFDRIVVVRTTYLVPIGSRGTVIGVLPISDPNPVRLECVKQTSYFLDVIFDKSIPFGNSIYGQANGRVMRVPETAVLCIFNSDNFNHNEVPEKTHQSSETRITDNTQKVNIMPEAATFNIGSLSKTNSTSASKLQNNLKNNEENISNSNAVAKEDFWMPAPETIKKNFIASAVADNSNLQKSYPNHVDNWKPTNTRKNNTVNMNIGSQESNLNSGTEALKSMLGLHAANTNMPLVNASQFPPPPNWRNSVGPMNKNNGLLPLPNSADITKKNDVPLQFYGQCLPHFAPQQQLPYVNDNFYSPMSLNQKGAFIPLQVLKSSPNKMAQELKDVEKIEETIKKCSIKDENRGRRSKSIPTEQPAQAASILLETPQTIVPKKAPKLPKIAARFDNL